MFGNETFHLVYIFLVIIRENHHHHCLSCDPRCYLYAAALHTPPPQQLTEEDPVLISFVLFLQGSSLACILIYTLFILSVR